MDQWQIWTEEWTGRVFCYEFATKRAAEEDMHKWHVARISMHWNGNVTSFEPEVLGEEGMALAHATIKKVAHHAYHTAFHKNMLKLEGLADAAHKADAAHRRLANDLDEVSEVEVELDGEGVRRVVHDEIIV